MWPSDSFLFFCVRSSQLTGRGVHVGDPALPTGVHGLSTTPYKKDSIVKHHESLPSNRLKVRACCTIDYAGRASQCARNSVAARRDHFLLAAVI